MFSVAPPKRRFCRFLYYPWFLRSTPPPTLERAVGQKRTATQSVVITYLIKKLNEKRKKTRQNIVLSTWFCQMTARQRYLRTPHAAISYVWFRQFFSPAAFSRLLPSVSVTVRRAKTEKGRALFTLERVICFPRQIIPPTTDDVCVFDWLKRGQKQGELCTLSGHDCWEAWPKTWWVRIFLASGPSPHKPIVVVGVSCPRVSICRCAFRDLRFSEVWDCGATRWR